MSLMNGVDVQKLEELAGSWVAILGRPGGSWSGRDMNEYSQVDSEMHGSRGIQAMRGKGALESFSRGYFHDTILNCTAATPSLLFVTAVSPCVIQGFYLFSQCKATIFLGYI